MIGTHPEGFEKRGVQSHVGGREASNHRYFSSFLPILCAQDLTTSRLCDDIPRPPRTPSLLIWNYWPCATVSKTQCLNHVQSKISQNNLAQNNPRIIDQRKENKNCIEDIPNIKPKMTASVFSVSWQMTLWGVFFGSKHVSMWEKHVSKLGFTLRDTWANTRSSKNDFKDIGNLPPPSLFSVSASSHAHQKLRFIFQSKWPSTNQRTKSSAVNICVKQTLVMYQPILGFCQRKLQQCRWGEQAHRGATKKNTNADTNAQEEDEDGQDRHGHRHQLQSGTGQPGPSRQPLHQPTRLWQTHEHNNDEDIDLQERDMSLGNIFSSAKMPFRITRTGDPCRLNSHEEGIRENQRCSEKIEVPL